ncbi:ROK family protein [Occultella glacieicola]|uniref:ROK family protein n=1 Tax=Occultella glacieicola TaxID=2518684 RepID=A0ABY2EC20_9MICO|nr:ROK family protein [Occultella glacieicola]TDE98712.1 ROK family protein [Occultella glacieicola]
MNTVIGVDLGGTKTAAALVGADGAVRGLHEVATPAKAGPGAVLEAVAGLVRRVAADAGAAPAGDGAGLVGLGVASAGVVEAHSGRIISATDAMSDWAGTDVAGGLRARLADVLAPEAPVGVLNDVDAHAVGEAWIGAGAGADVVLMVAAGTGIGAGLVARGLPWRGAHHSAGELGHLPSADAVGLRCTCGRDGHLEAIAAGPAIHRRYLALGGDPASADNRDVARRAAGGEETAVRALSETGRALGRGIAGIVTMLDPDVVVVGGGAAGAGDLWWGPMEAELRRELIPPLAGIELHPARLGPAAAIAGAARWLRLGRPWAGAGR